MRIHSLCADSCRARMRLTRADGWITYSSARRQGAGEFSVRYRPSADPVLRTPGSLEYWLTERYCLYTVVDGAIYSGHIHHEQWPLQDAEAEIYTNTMGQAAGIQLPSTTPLLHYSERLKVLIWPLQRLG